MDEPRYSERALERLVAATAAAALFYVDRGLNLDKVMELDVVASDFASARRFLVEAKSGHYQASDVFKVAGQAAALRIDNAAMAVPAVIPAQVSTAATLSGITMLPSDLTFEAIVSRVEGWLGAHVPRPAVRAYYRAYKVADQLLHGSTTREERQRYVNLGDAWDGYVAIHQPSWTSMSLGERTEIAYEAFRANPRAALNHAKELDDTSGSADTLGDVTTAVNSSKAFQDAIYRGQHQSLIYILLIDWLNRLEIARYATEWALNEPRDPVFADGRPRSFIAGVEEIRALPGRVRHLVPSVMQSVVFEWGGYFLDDRSDLLQAASEFGISADDYFACTRIVDSLFPQANNASWWRSSYGVSWLSLVPFGVQGAGVVYRDEVRPEWITEYRGAARDFLMKRRAAAIEAISTPESPAGLAVTT